MNIENVVGEVEKIIAPHINEMNLELVNVEYIQDGAYFYLRIYIEKIDGEVSLEDCASFSNLIEEKVDALIEDKFFLEVSSPGLERPLKKEKDFERFVGKKIKIISKNKIQDSRNVEGYLVKFENEVVFLDIDNEVYEIRFEDIKKANLVFDFKDF